MAKRGGFPGGGMPGNMANLMKQAQKMQRQMEEQAKLVKVKLDEEVVDPDDVEMLEDLLVAAVNEALDKVDEASAASMSKFTGGMNGLL